MNNDNIGNGSGHGSNFFSGFLVGALVGAAVVFLLGTKKGKKLLKAISEEGVENISNILENADKSVDLDEILEDESSLSTDKAKPKARRFFRGISRHAAN